MTRKSTAIRFADEERELIQSYADFQGESFSYVVRKAVLDQIDDWLDIRDYNEAIAADDGICYSHDEVGKLLGLT
jgi:predicted DNA-binding protein